MKRALFIALPLALILTGCTLPNMGTPNQTTAPNNAYGTPQPTPAQPSASPAGQSSGDIDQDLKAADKDMGSVNGDTAVPNTTSTDLGL